MKTEELSAQLDTLKSRIGRENGPLSILVEHGAIARFARALGETNPLYFDQDYARTTRFGAVVAPPTYVSCWVTALSEPLFEAHIPGFTITHIGDTARNHTPIRAGDTISAIARYKDADVTESAKGPRFRQIVEVTLTNQHDQTVSVVEIICMNYA